ncbi:MAG: hypothetical protein BJ554DRAFT_6090 [Olpidium bornovanus]|uniref:Uncharacterized protein n=1 Tax=Olpidium bornovanus TaxID=278681 RepID=A0A8H7ZYI3_9FUNG|nr:MAG: hypothetical protein BJ554DRAFT_6090 [Olpidium bornovanus]
MTLPKTQGLLPLISSTFGERLSLRRAASRRRHPDGEQPPVSACDDLDSISMPGMQHRVGGRRCHIFFSVLRPHHTLMFYQLLLAQAIHKGKVTGSFCFGQLNFKLRKAIDRECMGEQHLRVLSKTARRRFFQRGAKEAGTSLVRV